MRFRRFQGGRAGHLVTFFGVRLPKQKVIVQDLSKELPTAVRHLLDDCKAKRLTGWINVVYEDSHDLVLLVDGEMIGWGIFTGDRRRRTSPLEIYRRAQEKRLGAVSFFGLPAELVRMLWTTFVAKPKMGDMRMRTPDFKKFVGTLIKQGFDGCLEVIVDGGLNFLSFEKGQLRAVYPCDTPALEMGLSGLKVLLAELDRSGEEFLVHQYEGMVTEDAPSRPR